MIFSVPHAQSDMKFQTSPMPRPWSLRVRSNKNDHQRCVELRKHSNRDALLLIPSMCFIMVIMHACDDDYKYRYIPVYEVEVALSVTVHSNCNICMSVGVSAYACHFSLKPHVILRTEIKLG